MSQLDKFLSDSDIIALTRAPDIDLVAWWGPCQLQSWFLCKERVGFSGGSHTELVLLSCAWAQAMERHRNRHRYGHGKGCRYGFGYGEGFDRCGHGDGNGHEYGHRDENGHGKTRVWMWTTQWFEQPQWALWDSPPELARWELRWDWRHPSSSLPESFPRSWFPRSSANAE